MKHAKRILVYPLHGICTLEAIENRVYQEQLRPYYNLYFPKLRLRLWVPEQRALQKGLREVSDTSSVMIAKTVFFEKHQELPQNTTDRYHLLKEKIECGHVQDYFQILRDIICAKIYKLKLNAHDRSVYQIAQEMLVNELGYVLDISATDATSYIKEEIEKRQRNL